MIFAPFFVVDRVERAMRSLNACRLPNGSFISMARMTSACEMTDLRNEWFSGWREGKFIRPALSTTAHCSVSASSTRRAMPAGVRGGEPIADHHRILSSHQHLCCVGKRACISYRRHDPGELWYAQSLRIGDGIFLQLRVERGRSRAHRGRRRDLVGGPRRLGEMLERSGLVVPLDKVAYDCGRV